MQSHLHLYRRCGVDYCGTPSQPFNDVFDHVLSICLYFTRHWPVCILFDEFCTMRIGSTERDCDFGR